MNKDPSSSTLRHAALERLRFIDSRLFWEARINRADLMDRYAVSPAQAALDFKEYLKFAEHGVVYDAREKSYVADAKFCPVFGEPDASRTLSEFAAAGDPYINVLPRLERPLDAKVAARVRRAARLKEKLRIEYQSFTSPDLRWRWIAPARLVSDGERWHARSFCFEHQEWRDFVLGRIAGIGSSEPAGDLPLDREWDEELILVLKPLEDLTRSQKAAVLREYAMRAGRLLITIPKAMRLYAIRRWGLDRPTTRLGYEERSVKD
jgi:hypothetical protein